MSTKEERILEALRARLATISGATVAIDPPDDHADRGTFPRIAIIPGATAKRKDGQRVQVPVAIDVTVRGVTQTPAAEPGDDDVPISPRTAAYALWRQMMAALFPVPTYGTGTYHDSLGALGATVLYSAHEIASRDDGGNTSGAFIDLEIEYTLHTNDPDR